VVVLLEAGMLIVKTSDEGIIFQKAENSKIAPNFLEYCIYSLLVVVTHRHPCLE
jgi:hypothetical protein